MTQLNNLVAAVCERPVTDVMPIAMKLLGKDDLKLARLLVLKFCFI